MTPASLLPAAGNALETLNNSRATLFIQTEIENGKR
jgi:hypothetical protein